MRQIRPLCALIVAGTLAVGIGHAQGRFSYLISGGVVRNNVSDVIGPYRVASFLIEGGVFYDLSPGGTMFDFTGPLQLSFTTGFHSWVDPARVYPTTNAPPEQLRNSIDIPILTGARWQLTKTGVSPYLSTEIGLHYVSRDYQNVAAVFPPGTPGYFQIASAGTATESILRFGYRLGAGISVSLGANLQLDLCARHDEILGRFVYDRALGHSTNGIKFVDVTLGVRFRF